MSEASYMDPELSAIGEARTKARDARRAFEAFQGVSQEQADRIVEAMAEAARTSAAELARLAVDETGYGIYEDKILKNLFNALFCANAMKTMRTLGVLWVDEVNRVTAIGAPMGVIAGIIPVTNPTSTTIYKCLAAVKSGNAIVCTPHPRAAKCCARTVEIMAAAAERAGAPRNLVSCLSGGQLAATRELMSHRDVALVMATGGPGMVRAAYSSGKPTLAVGAGNVPVYIHRSVADVEEAALMVVTSKSFDNGTACVAEQSVVLDEPIAAQALQAFQRHGTFFLPPDAQDRLARLLFGERGALNPDAVGQTALELARRIGLSVPANTRVLAAELTEVGPQVPLSAEILGPVLTFYRTSDLEAAYRQCQAILAFGGEGHTLGIHGQDQDMIARLSALAASRIIVNTPSLLGGMGFSAGTDPSFMLGTGTWSGSIVSDNVTPMHLINIKRIAHENRPWRDIYKPTMGL
ncbi:aldehyde dehydrogenase family protein [Variovorax sp. Sphag1AA]|uniref:aldehyde dehydrogenase family protein n=1 Tax=Variovorax sp. Sphag1AA TaxID=2587027 RepID=UPI00161E3A45|nr:aldehyde dehydrogenase family protein [Variovorax sp. Sphag1AA]MBB3180974.1 acetaldehyde dehydrogenase (acetylating) [Variovorax sp. Sphag1AA]